jgi:hypothetical protein
VGGRGVLKERSRKKESRVERVKMVMSIAVMCMIIRGVECLGGQSIEISTNVNANVAGNGDVGNNGQEPFNGEVVGNTITVRGNSTIGTDGDAKDVAGSRNDDKEGEAVKNNRAVIETAGIIWGRCFGRV